MRTFEQPTKEAPPAKIQNPVLLAKLEQRERDVAELKRQGYADEVITTILPIINDGR